MLYTQFETGVEEDGMGEKKKIKKCLATTIRIIVVGKDL